MTWEEARTFFDRYSWLLFQERETGEQVPSDVREKLEEAYQVLRKGEIG